MNYTSGLIKLLNEETLLFLQVPISKIMNELGKKNYVFDITGTRYRLSPHLIRYKNDFSTRLENDYSKIQKVIDHIQCYNESDSEIYINNFEKLKKEMNNFINSIKDRFELSKEIKK